MKFTIFMLALVTLLSGNIFSQVIPKQISYQGILKDASGNVLTGDFTITFKIYNDPTGGTPLWTEIQAVSVASGLFSLQLGSITPITTVPFDRIHFLGITVGTESELAPRTLLSPSPYSFMSMNVLDNIITTSKIQDGAVTGLKIGSNEVVKSLNGIKDSVNLVAGTNITITTTGNNITIAAAAGGGGGTVTQVNTGSGLTGGPITTTGTVSVANDGVTSTMLQNNSVTTAKITDGTITATDIANTQIVKSLNTLKDNVTLIAGSNITITPGGNNLTIASTSSGMGGSGTANYLSLFTGSTTLGNSVLYQTGGNIGIGTTTPGAKFDLSGSDALINGLTIGRGSGNSASNTAFGIGALYSNTTGIYNTANGYEALYYNTTGVNNTATGRYALYLNSTGNYNTADGYGVLYSNTSGSHNTANGYRALYTNNIGYDNTANGYRTLYANTTGYGNTANGYEALYSNTTGANNTANGYQSLFFNNEGTRNTANGYQSLYSNTTGGYNTAIGGIALYSNTTGMDNTSIGYRALYSNTSGDYNTANGGFALSFNITGNQNTAHGYYSLYSNTTGANNTANGYQALYLNNSGNYNTANGIFTLYSNTIESYNTGIGYSAGDYYTFTSGTFLGANAYPNTNGYVNITGLGYYARPTASNQVRIGNSSVTSIGGYAGWTNFSDGRYKLAVSENVKGLDFIMRLRPVTYQLDMNRLSTDLKEDQRKDKNGNITTAPTENDIKPRNEKSQIVYTGFIAQEVEKAAQEVGFNFSGVDAPKNENDFYGLRYAEFVVPLVKAVQEQQKIIEELTKRIEELERK